MLKRLFSPDPFKTFYLVFAYIFIFSLWWGYLLYAKNETAFNEKVELNQRQFKLSNTSGDYFATNDFQEIHSKYLRQKLMIVTEGSVFFLLLFAGLVVVRRVFKREIELAQLQRNFLLSITHELKSPLSTIKVSLQTLLKRKLEPNQTEKLMNNSLVDLDRLEALVDNILVAAKMERDEPGFTNEEINVSQMVFHLAERFSTNKKNIVITCHPEPDIHLRVDQVGFTSLVINLIENAVKYSEPETEVTLHVKQDEKYVYFSVTDQGLGIADEEKGKVFDKFYRVGNEDTRKTKGTGLGLYIVKRFVEIYHGEIKITDNQPRGSIFSLRFPMNG